MGIGEGEVPPIESDDGEVLLFTPTIVGPLAAIMVQLEVGQLDTIQALVTEGLRTVNDKNRLTGKSTNEDSVRH